MDGIVDGDVSEASEPSPHDDVAGWRIIRPTEIAAETGDPVEVASEGCERCRRRLPELVE